MGTEELYVAVVFIFAIGAGVGYYFTKIVLGI